MNCQTCNDTGWTGDNNAGFEGNTEVHPCECEKGIKVTKAIKLLGVDVAKDLILFNSLYSRIEKLEEENLKLRNEICDLKGYARMIDVSEFMEKKDVHGN